MFSPKSIRAFRISGSAASLISPENKFLPKVHSLELVSNSEIQFSKHLLGHFGKVYLTELILSEDDQGNRQIIQVACKEMKPEFAQDAFDEARVMASIRLVNFHKVTRFLGICTW